MAAFSRLASCLKLSYWTNAFPNTILMESLSYDFFFQRLAISKLNDMINKAEENMVELRRQYELSVQERNKRGMYVVCVDFLLSTITGWSILWHRNDN